MGRSTQFHGEAKVKLNPMVKSGYVVYVKRTAEERLAIAKKICNLYSTGLYSITAICDACQVKVNSFMNWAAPAVNVAELMIKGEPLPKNCIPQVNQWYKEAQQSHKRAYMELLRERAKVGIMKKIEGVEWEEVTEDEEIDNETQEMKVVKRRTKRGKYAPDTAALIFVLTNTDPDTFKNTNKFQQVNNTQNNFNGLEGLSDEELQHKLMEKRAELLRLDRGDTNTESLDFEDVNETEDEDEGTNDDDHE